MSQTYTLRVTRHFGGGVHFHLGAGAPSAPALSLLGPCTNTGVVPARHPHRQAYLVHHPLQRLEEVGAPCMVGVVSRGKQHQGIVSRSVDSMAWTGTKCCNSVASSGRDKVRSTGARAETGTECCGSATHTG